MACPLTLAKFTGTVSLGLLTGVSYASSAITIPSLQGLPTASTASRTLQAIKTRSRKHAMTLCAISEFSFLFSYSLASPRRKHPYMLWATLLGAVGVIGVDWGATRATLCAVIVRSRELLSGQSSVSTQAAREEDRDIEMVEKDEDSINGESVRNDMEAERKMQQRRSYIVGAAFVVAVIGIWGDVA